MFCVAPKVNLGAADRGIGTQCKYEHLSSQNTGSSVTENIRAEMIWHGEGRSSWNVPYHAQSSIMLTSTLTQNSTVAP